MKAQRRIGTRGNSRDSIEKCNRGGQEQHRPRMALTDSVSRWVMVTVDVTLMPPWRRLSGGKSDAQTHLLLLAEVDVGRLLVEADAEPFKLMLREMSGVKIGALPNMHSTRVTHTYTQTHTDTHRHTHTHTYTHTQTSRIFLCCSGFSTSSTMKIRLHVRATSVNKQHGAVIRVTYRQ
jgi:hypothetical protein